MKTYGFEHHHHYQPFEGAPAWAVELGVMLALSLEQGTKIMSDITDTDAVIDAIATEVPTIATGVGNILTLLAGFQNSTTSVLSPADAAAVADMKTAAATIKSSLDAISASLPAPAAPATPAAAAAVPAPAAASAAAPVAPVAAAAKTS